MVSVARPSPNEAFRGSPALELQPPNPVVRLANPVGAAPNRLPVYPAVPLDNSPRGIGFANPGIVSPGVGNSGYVSPGLNANAGLVNPGLHPLDPYSRSVKGSVRIPFNGFNGVGAIFDQYPTSPSYGSLSGRIGFNK